MFKFIKKVPTVADALQGFHKAIAELKEVQAHHDAEAAKHEAIAVRVQEEAAAIIAKAKAAAAHAIERAEKLEAEGIARASALQAAAEAEARAAVQAIARVESFLGL